MANKMLEGKVVKGVGGRFKVLCGGKALNCSARGKLHLEDKILIGDTVTVAEIRGEYVIVNILPRRNKLIRPPVANIDMLVIVVAPLPATDWVLVDKLLIFAAEYGITPVLCYNKIDLTAAELDYAGKVYGGIADIVAVSALTKEGFDALKERLSGVVCFAGQSAVGKSSLLNLFGEKQETGDLSRIERGKNTTRHVQLFEIKEGLMIVDTCGFSLLDLEGIKPEEIMLYYSDFLALPKCRYNMCTHTAEPGCEVKAAVEAGTIDKGRYDRYLAIYNEATERRKLQ